MKVKLNGREILLGPDEDSPDGNPIVGTWASIRSGGWAPLVLTGEVCGAVFIVVDEAKIAVESDDGTSVIPTVSSVDDVGNALDVPPVWLAVALCSSTDTSNEGHLSMSEQTLGALRVFTCVG